MATQSQHDPTGAAGSQSTADDVAADRELKSRHRAMWALGDYAAIADAITAKLAPVLLDACTVADGVRVLDVAAGTGNVAIPAARRGAEVVASDLTPELLDRGRARAEADGLELRWEQADAEALPFRDGEFDVVLSCVGAMFAPHHQRTADEMVRVLRPGGRLGFIAWTPEGFVGQLFAVMRPYAAPPPPGVQPPPLWGSEDHVRSLFEDAVTDLETKRQNVTIDSFAAPEEFRDLFKFCYGPTVAAYKRVADDQEQTAALDRDLVELARRTGLGDGTTSMDWEYLLVTARKRG